MTQYTEQEQAQLLTLTSIIADSWSRVTDLKSLIASLTAETAGIDNEAFDRTKVVDAFQDLVDAHLVCIGQLESALNKADFIADEAEENKSEDENEEEAGVEAEAATDDAVEDAAEDDSDNILTNLADELDVCMTDDAIIIAKKDEMDDEDASKIEPSRQSKKPADEDTDMEEPVGPWSYWVDFD